MPLTSSSPACSLFVKSLLTWDFDKATNGNLPSVEQMVAGGPGGGGAAAHRIGSPNRLITVFSVCIRGSTLNAWAVCCTDKSAVDTAEFNRSREVSGFWLNW